MNKIHSLCDDEQGDTLKNHCANIRFLPEYLDLVLESLETIPSLDPTSGVELFSTLGHVFSRLHFSNDVEMVYTEDDLREIVEPIVEVFFSSTESKKLVNETPIKETPLFLDIAQDIKKFYKVLKFVGSGTNGMVYEIEHKFFKERKALKQYRELAIIEDIESKFKKLQTLKQPCHVLPIEKFSYRFINNHYKVEMISPLLQMSLQDFVPKLKLMKNRDKLLEEILLQTFKGVISMHDIELSHNDIKEANILLSYNEPDVYVCLADFELADESTSTSISSEFGTKPYLPPETIKSKHKSTKIDIWSLGVTFFKIMCEIWNIDPKLNYLEDNSDDSMIYTNHVCLGKIYSREKLNEYLVKILKNYSDHFITIFIKKALTFDHTVRPSARDLYEFIQIRFGNNL